MRRLIVFCCALALALAAVLAAPAPAFAQAPVVKTVPWVATNQLVPHDTWSGKSIRLKGTSSLQGAAIQGVWDFGDGTPVFGPFAVTNGYIIEASHAYTGTPGTVFTARLTVTNTSTGESGSAIYLVEIRDLTIDVEVNVAIDEGLWYLHKTMTRFDCAAGLPCGQWTSGNAGHPSNYAANQAANLNAFLVNGHVEGGDPSNPYVETVQRAVRRVFGYLASGAIANQTNPLGTFSPDSNGNGLGIFVNQGNPFYQGGPVIDAIVATGTPAKVVDYGGGNVIGRPYSDIVRDMVDYYAYCQYDSGAGAGGWRYSCNEFPDNSAAQWGAIGLLAAHRWGIEPASIVKQVNLNYWLAYSQNATTGVFGYTNTSPIWGPYATTPSGMVQLAMDGVGRGNTRWDKAETYMRNNFGNCCGATVAVKDYYYGLFALVKALLLHDSNGDGIAEPLSLLGTVNPIDWYHAQLSLGDPTDGIARTLVGDQNASGYWYAHNYDGTQYYFETAWAIMMLSRTLFEAGAPVAVATALPNPAVVGQVVTLDGSASFHQDAAKVVDSWDWQICKTPGVPIGSCGTIENQSGPVVTSSFGALGVYQARLTVTDNGVPEKSASTLVSVNVAIPPLAPTADADGPYSFCPATTPWFLDGSGSVNPDDGAAEPGQPGDFIKEYAWDLDGDGQFDDATGAQPDVTAYFAARGVGSYLIQLRVTDNTGTSFPSSGQPDLTDTDSAQVFVRAADDPLCGCIRNLAARAKPGKADLTWSLFTGATFYNVYRGTISGGPYLKVGTVTGTVYVDTPLVNNTTYYWVVRPTLANLTEVCQSNQASATPRTR